MPKRELRQARREKNQCVECGLSANGQLRCTRCYEVRTAYRQRKRKGILAKKREKPSFDEAAHDFDFNISSDVARRLEAELQQFQVVFTEGNVQGQRLSGLLRGYVVHGLRARGEPTAQEIREIKRKAVEGEKVTGRFTKREHDELVKLSVPHKYDLASFLSAIVEREVQHRERIPVTPRLDGLRGGVVLVKSMRQIERAPTFLYAKNLSPTPIRTGYDSIRSLIRMPTRDPLGEFPDPPPTERVTIRLTRNEIFALDQLRKQYFRWVPKRGEVFREMFYEIADQKWFDLRERADVYQKAISECLDKSIECDRSVKECNRKVKRARAQRDRALALVAELTDRFVVQQAALMELGKYPFDEDTVKTAESILKSWDAFKGDLKSLYSALSAREIESVASMVKEEKSAWRDQQTKAFEELARRSRETTRLLLGGEPEQKKLNGAANGSPLS